MTRLRGLSWRDVERALKNCGFEIWQKKGKGSHIPSARQVSSPDGYGKVKLSGGDT